MIFHSYVIYSLPEDNPQIEVASAAFHRLQYAEAPQPTRNPPRHKPRPAAWMAPLG